MKRDAISYYPVFLNVAGKKCVVVGGGQVALRKVKGLLDAGAEVRVISPALCPGLIRLAETARIVLETRQFQPGDLKGAAIAIAATDDNRTNSEVAKEARGSGVAVNVVDDPGSSDFIAPSCLSRGDVTIAVSTAGRSPALARKIRARLESEFGDEYAALALVVGEVRAEVKSRGYKVRSEDWQRALDLDALTDLLKQHDRDQARSLLLGNLQALQG